MAERRRIGMTIKRHLLRSTIHSISHLRLLVRWLLLSLMTGVVIGGIGSLFALCMTQATELRTTYHWMMYLLPVGGIAIILLYRLTNYQNDRGTNMVIASIHAESEIPGKMAPTIFAATIITHLVGGSAGREGAALQMGGSLGAVVGRLLHLKDNDRRLLVMCGMSAVFSAGFGTPLAAAVFAMEIGSVGVMYYAALVPCAVSSITAWRVAVWMGVEHDDFLTAALPDLSIIGAGWTILLGILCAALSIIFCITLQKTHGLLKKWITNPYIRIAAAGCFLILCTLLLGTQDYLGAGVPVIQQALQGKVVWYAFLIKIIFTAVTIESGYKGGEIVPSFFIGATFGAVFGQLTGFSPALCAAVGMVSIFCGVTNCPITSLLIAFELFHFEKPYYFLIGIAISYMLSGYYGLYRDQKIVYSKYQTKYINRYTKNV